MNRVIEVNEVFFSYPGSDRKVLNECSLDIEQGELVSILGSNGAGKSTLLNCIAGLFSVDDGSIKLCEKDIKQLHQKDIAKIIGYVQQNQRSNFAYSVFDYVMMGRAYNVGLFEKPGKEDEEIVKEVLKNMDIDYMSDKSITELSGGERQQIAIARAVVQKPKAILFDEPTAHLDYGNQIKTLRMIDDLRKKGFAVIMTTHNPDHCMMLGGKVAVMNSEGKLEVGDYMKILTSDMLNRLYDTEVFTGYFNEIKRFACVPKGL